MNTTAQYPLKVLYMPGQVPTLPTVANHKTPGWLPETDIYPGQVAINLPDGLLFLRSYNVIKGPYLTLADIITAIAGAMVINEVPSGAVDGANTVFTTANNFVPGTLAFYYESGRQLSGTDFTETGSNQFTTSFTPDAGSRLITDYIKA